MALYKNKRRVTECPRCHSTDIFCRRRRQRPVDDQMTVEYVLWCNQCGKIVKTGTSFSAFGKDVSLYGLCCPFCGKGRSRHHFWKETNWARKTGTEK